MRPKAQGEGEPDGKPTSEGAYRPVKQPTMLMDRVDELVADNDYGFRTVQEFVATCIRDGLQKYGKRPS